MLNCLIDHHKQTYTRKNILTIVFITCTAFNYDWNIYLIILSDRLSDLQFCVILFEIVMFSPEICSKWKILSEYYFCCFSPYSSWIRSECEFVFFFSTRWINLAHDMEQCDWIKTNEREKKIIIWPCVHNIIKKKEKVTNKRFMVFNSLTKGNEKVLWIKNFFS